MRRVFFIICVLCFITANISLNAQNYRPGVEDRPEFRRLALDITIESRILENEIVVWSEINQKVTVQGSPVGIQLVGSNIIVVIQFTPYIRSNGSVLASQGQIWLAESEDELEYYYSIETIPFELGKPVHYLPLGSEQLNPVIEIIISIDSYNERTRGR